MKVAIQSAKTVSDDAERGQVMPASKSANDLIRWAKEHPSQPIVQGLLNEGEILLLHGSEDSYKSFFVLQVADSIARGRPLLNWGVPHARRVGVIETELNEASLGERLNRMFPEGRGPENLCFLSESGLHDWRRLSLLQKIEFVQKWVNGEGVQILMVDTANDFFRRTDNPSQERSVGEFFDELRSIEVGAHLIVRHDRKTKDNGGNPNDRIRGAGEWKEDPEAIVSLVRKDRRTNEVVLDVGKLRYGQKPEPLTLWFDTREFRLTALPPVINVLRGGRQPRKQILTACEERFGIAQRAVDQMLDDQSLYLTEEQQGHEKHFEVNLESASDAPWACFYATNRAVRA